MKLLITAGGTGGHIFPSLALAKELKEKHGCEILFAGGGLSKNAYFRSDSFAFRDISCSNHLITGAGRNMQGIWQSAGIIRSFDPEAIVGFGSYYTMPVLAACALLRRPFFLHEANSIPGRVNRLFSPFAKKTWVYFPEALKRLQGEVEQCAMPLREQFKKDRVTKEEALHYFGLTGERMTLLVFGGSQGAQGINALFSLPVLQRVLKQVPDIQIIHLTGTDEEACRLSSLYAEVNIPCFVRPFEKRMELAWAAADVSITRAGALSVAEQCLYEVPGILIPFPRATDDHQRFNAEYLVNIGLGKLLLEQSLDGSSFSEQLLMLIRRKDKMLEKFYAHNIRDLQDGLADQIMLTLKDGGK